MLTALDFFLSAKKVAKDLEKAQKADDEEFYILVVIVTRDLIASCLWLYRAGVHGGLIR